MSIKFAILALLAEKPRHGMRSKKTSSIGAQIIPGP